MEKEKASKLDLNPNIEWTSHFESLGVNAKFLSFWNRATAFNFGITPSIFVDVWPVEPGEHLDQKFAESLLKEIVGEITEKILKKDGRDEYDLSLDVDSYDEEQKILGLVALEESEFPASKNEIPL